jgi:integrase
MAIHKLGDISETKLARLLQQPGRHADGGGLYLQVAAAGQGSWMSRVGECWKSAGPADETSVEAARELHRVRKAQYKGTAAIVSAPFPATPAPMPAPIVPDNRARFAAVLETYLALNAPQWKASNRDHNSAKYHQLLETPLATLWVDAITSEDIVTAFKPMSLGVAESHRMRIKLMLDYAAAKGLRDKLIPNPASKDILKHLIPNAPKSKPHPAMPSEMVPALMVSLAADGSPAARALAFQILTAARPGEVRGADWSEIEGNVWTVPAERMKESVEHTVPLSSVALALLGPRGSGRIFAGLAERALDTKLKAHKPEGVKGSVHGFRACFSGDWAAKAGYSLELRERALAHKVGGDVISRYNRDTLLAQRAEMMQAWADFVAR